MRWLILLPFVLMFLVYTYGPASQKQDSPVMSRADEIEAGCTREFVGDPDAIRSCQTVLIARELDKIQAEKLSRAAR